MRAVRGSSVTECVSSAGRGDTSHGDCRRRDERRQLAQPGTQALRPADESTLEEQDMQATRLLAAAVLAACTAVASVPAQAAGCLKGAAVGGVGGHFAGHHAVAGAVVGCAVGHHLAAKKEREDRAAAAANQPPASAPRR
jgi:hypothetical protein